jgi:hypothetical protein
VSASTLRKFLPQPALAGLANAETNPAKTTIGIQVGAISFLDEGAENLLDIFQQSGSVARRFARRTTVGGPRWRRT